MTNFDIATIHTVTTGLLFPEGPVFDADGSVLVPEIEGGSVTRVRPDGTRELCGRLWRWCERRGLWPRWRTLHLQRRRVYF